MRNAAPNSEATKDAKTNRNSGEEPVNLSAVSVSASNFVRLIRIS
jgi:hypothetical protein